MIAAGLVSAFLAKMIATALVVIVVAWTAARAGPLMGGVIVGLPIVLAPGFFFIAAEQPAAFVETAAVGAIYALAATEVFLAAYVGASRGSGASVLATLSIASLAWIVSAPLLAMLPQHPVAGLAIFVAASFGLRRLTRSWVSDTPATPGRLRWGLLLVRGACAGVLVGAVSIAAGLVGPSWTGVLMSFPIGFCAVLYALQRDHGSILAAATARSGMAGIASLAVFLFVLATGTPALGAWPAFGSALFASLAYTLVAALVAHRSAKAA